MAIKWLRLERVLNAERRKVESDGDVRSDRGSPINKQGSGRYWWHVALASVMAIFISGPSFNTALAATVARTDPSLVMLPYDCCSRLF